MSMPSLDLGPASKARFCLRTHPKHEHFAAAQLGREADLEVFSPRIRGSVWVAEALFQNYIFAKFDLLASLHTVQAARGVRGVVHFGNRWPTVPEAADATRKSYAEAISYSKQIVDEPKTTVGDRIDYLQLLHLVNATNFSTWQASMKQGAGRSPVEAFALGRWMAAAENPTNALRWLQSLPSAIQTNQPVPLIIADCHVALKDWSGLMALLDKQDWAEANYFRLALESRAQRSLDEDFTSQTSWRKALRLANHRLDRLARLAEVTSCWGWDSENTEVLKEITSTFPKEKWAGEQLVAKLYAAGDSRALGDLLAKLYAADPSDVKSKNNLASISLLRNADLERAYRLAREAYDSAPDNPFCTSTYAYSLQNKQVMALKVVGHVLFDH